MMNPKTPKTEQLLSQRIWDLQYELKHRLGRATADMTYMNDVLRELGLIALAAEEREAEEAGRLMPQRSRPLPPAPPKTSDPKVASLDDFRNRKAMKGFEIVPNDDPRS